MGKIERTYISDEMKDLRREREILANEAIEGKNIFAENIKDSLGEEIRRELEKKSVVVEEQPKKESKFKKFLDKLSNICQ